jgi:hypothetical protein
VNEKRGTLRLIAAANFIFAIIFVIIGLPFFWRQWQVLRNWPETDAQVIRSEVVAVAIGHDNYYRAKLQMVYTVAGQPIVSELTSFESKNYEATLQRAEQFPVGSHHPIRYDPSSPSRARVGAGWNKTFFALPIIVGVTALFFFFVGAVLLAVAKT